MARPKKTVEEEVSSEIVEEIKTTEVDETTKVDPLQEALALIKKLNEELATVKSQQQQPIIIQQSNSEIGSKRIKVINLMHNEVNISTAQNGRGRNYNFSEYGKHHMITGDMLAEIYANYPNTIENVLVYICSDEFVQYHGLSEFYEKNAYTKEILDKMIYMRDDTDVDLFLGMNEYMQKSVASEIARNLADGEYMDLNRLQSIKSNSAYDIRKMADEIISEKERV